jgi:hypothetical protein
MPPEKSDGILVIILVFDNPPVDVGILNSRQRLIDVQQIKGP